MIASAHNSTGAMLALSALYIERSHPDNMISNPIILLTLLAAVSVMSHYLLDVIPHGHYKSSTSKVKINKKELFMSALYIGMADFIVSATVLIVVFASLLGHQSLIYLLIAGFFSQLPDIFMLLNDTGIASKNKFIQLEQSFHAGPVHWHDSKNDSPRPWKIYDFWQIALTVIALILTIEYAEYIL